MAAAFRVICVSLPLVEGLSEELAGMGLEGVEVSLLTAAELQRERLEAAELVLCAAPSEVERVLEVAAVRVYTVREYLGIPEEADLDPIDAVRQLTQQIGRELESDPARPGAAARD